MDEKNKDESPVAYVGMRLQGTHHLTSLSEVLSKLASKFRIENISSVFRLAQKDRGQPEFSLVILIETHLSSEDLQTKLEEIKRDLESKWMGRNIEIVFLARGPEFVLTPCLALPYPDWMDRPEFLVPAAELSPEFFHPVLEEKLGELAQKVSRDWGIVLWIKSFPPRI